MSRAPEMTQRSTPAYVVQGRTVTMPVEVRDASNGVVMFMVPAAGAQALIPGDAFEVVDLGGGQAQLVLGIVDYRDNDLGDYHEVALVFFVRPRGAPPEATGTFIYKLPVNQEFTRAAGFQIWGFPKTVERITYEYTEDRATGALVTATLVMDGRAVFALTLPRRQPERGVAPDPPLEGYTYTYIEGVPHRTRFTTGGTGTVVTAGGEGVELTLGTHPLADALRGLGLPAPPLMSSWTEHMQGSFGPPERL
jgi:Acetoacetate decarboxylase (ADC)